MLNKIFSSAPLSPLRAYLLSGFRSEVLWPLSPSDHCREDQWRDAVAKAGCEPVRVIRVRGNRIVVLVDHPDHGRCVLKWTCPVLVSGLGFANEAIARKIQATNNGIFPDIYSITSSSILSRFIGGVSIEERISTCSLNRQSIKNYLYSLRDWSLSLREEAGSRLCPADVRQISREYIGKCLSHYRYRSHSERLQSALAVRARQKSFASAVAMLSNASEKLDLPCSLMCGDMGMGNIIEEFGTGRLYNVDYEELRVGHWGFDAVYLVASILEMNPSSEEKEDMFSLVLSDDYLGGPKAGDYFRNLAKLLIDIGNTIFLPRHVVKAMPASPVTLVQEQIETNSSW